MRIAFKTKLTERQNFSTLQTERVYNIPKITRSHCDMNAARSSKRFGAYANSDLFERMVQRAVHEKYGDYIRASEANVIKAGFLATVELEVL